MKTLLLVIWVSAAFADVAGEVLIKGRIGSTFDEKQVKVIDSQGQSYYLPRKVFPKDFVFREGSLFTIEVDEAHLKNLKLIKKK